MSGHYDVLIIGAGQAGGPLSTAFGKAGRKTALIEREHVGGTCINVGCTPTKTMIASARVAYLARRSAEYGVHVGAITVDLAKVRQRKRAIVERWRSGSRRQIEEADGVDLYDGEAEFTGPKTVNVRLNSGKTCSLTGETIIINTGARPANPPLEGLDGVSMLTSTTIMELDTVPHHLLVLGGGYIGLEFAQMFRRFGSAITIVQRSDQLLTHEDRDIAEEVVTILREDGIRVLLNTDAQRVAQDADGTIHLTVRTPDGDTVLDGSHLLVATGRTPNTEALKLHVAGIHTDQRGHILVNERLETNVAGIYALGDVTGGPAFTHISYDDFRIMRTNLIEGGSATTAGRLVPYTVFIDPQLGRVGLTEHEARQQGFTIRVATLPMNAVARAIEVDETRGIMKAIVDVQTNYILGCAILGIEGGEIMSALQIAMLGNLPYTVLRDGVFAHPTLIESLNNLFMALDAQ